MPYFTRFMLIMLLVTVACEPESESGAAFPMDGEGDTVRVLTIDLTDEVDVVRVIPLASIGAAEGTVEETLYGAYSGFLDAAGRVVVANSRGPDVREYSLDGQFIRLFGRSGRGPGEFIQAGRIVQL